MASFKIVRVKPGEVKIGEPLRWAVYTLKNSLLLKKGTVVSSSKQLQVLIERGIYREMTQEEIQEEERRHARERRRQQRVDPFRLRKQCMDILAGLLEGIENHTRKVSEYELEDLAEDFQWLCERHADSTLGAIHLCPEFRYNVLHPIHSAVLCELLGKKLQLPEENRIAMIMAALFMNVGMFTLQERLFAQHSPLTAKQKTEVFEHPLKSRDLLEHAGVTNPLCLQAVLEHHERIDGKGYPQKLPGEQICTEAKIIALADMYSAMVTPRRHRQPIFAKEAMKSIFEKRGNEVDEVLAAQFIREVGVFPPGSVVRLVNSKIAIVSKRQVSRKSGDSTHPTVYSVLAPRGALYEKPKKRECTHEMFRILGFEPKDKIPPLDPKSIWPH